MPYTIEKPKAPKQTPYTPELLRGPLSPELAKERQILLAVSALGIGIAWAGLLPRSITLLGIQSGDLNPQGFAQMLALVVAYFALGFAASGWSDYRRWRWQLPSLKMGDSAPVSGANAMSVLPAFDSLREAVGRDGVSRSQIIWDNRAALIRAFFDLVLPLLTAAFALYLLCSRAPTPPSEAPASLVSIIGAKESSPLGPVEKTLVLVPTTAAVLFNERSTSLATFVIPFAEAGCSGGQPPDNWRGVVPETTHVPFIQSLAADLSACGEQDHHVHLEVYGYSSSSEVKNFQGCSGAKTSNEANLRIADKRRDAVATLLQNATGSYLNIDRHDWNGDYGAMEESRLFNDRVLDAYDNRRGTLNRRVEIRLVKAGACRFPLSGS